MTHPVAFAHVPPYRWTGSNASARSLRDDDRLIAMHHFTNAVIPIGAPTFFHRSLDHAYAVYPLVDAYTTHGKRQRETGLHAFGLVRTPAGWRIASVTFAKQGDTDMPAGTAARHRRNERTHPLVVDARQRVWRCRSRTTGNLAHDFANGEAHCHYARPTSG